MWRFNPRPQVGPKNETAPRKQRRAEVFIPVPSGVTETVVPLRWANPNGDLGDGWRVDFGTLRVPWFLSGCTLSH